MAIFVNKQEYFVVPNTVGQDSQLIAYSKILKGSQNALLQLFVCIIHLSGSPNQRRYIQSYNEISASAVQLYFATNPKALFITTHCVFGRRSKDAAHRDHKSRARRRVLISRRVSFKLTLQTSLSLSVKTSHWPNSSRFGGQFRRLICDAHQSENFAAPEGRVYQLAGRAVAARRRSAKKMFARKCRSLVGEK
jgi:hypothetical protein